MKGFEAASKFRLLEGGKLLALTDSQQLKVIKRLSRSPDSPGAMPPKGSGIEPLTEAEALSVFDALDARKE